MRRRRVDCRRWDCRELLVTASKLNCIADPWRELPRRCCAASWGWTPTNWQGYHHPGWWWGLNVKVVKLTLVKRVWKLQNSNLLLFQVILKANTVDVKLLWIRRMRQLIQVKILSLHLWSRYMLSHVKPGINIVYWSWRMSTLLLVQNLLTYFLTNTYLLAGHLLRVELSAGELALPLSAPGQVQHHQPEEQQVKPHFFGILNTSWTGIVLVQRYV